MKFYITTPLYYVNSKPHIGHSYTQVACDAAARFMRGERRDVFFMTGTDEHGEKIEAATLKAGYKEGEEKDFVDGIVPLFREAWKKLDIDYDYFIRTTDDYHIKSVQSVFAALNERGKIYKKAYKGWFCTPCETFWSEAQSPDGVCPDCKRPAEKLDELNYFLKISEYQAWLIDYIRSHPDFIKPDFRRNEVLGFLNEPLVDLCVSRPKSRMSWGIEIPFDRDYVAYVWFDALINYISGAGYPHDMARFRKLWPCEFHVIGKDILRHHAVYWPIMLKSLDIELPKTIFAHGWWVIKGEKMSKSKGNVVDPAEMAARYGVDAYRYFLLREIPFGLDGAFSEEAFVSRYNSDLANDLGNLLSRTVTMAEKYFGGAVPEPGAGRQAAQGTGNGLRRSAEDLLAVLEEKVPRLDFAAALTRIWETVNLANKFIEDSKPWTLSREGRISELALAIYILLETLRIIGACLYPFMPHTAKAIWAQLGVKEDIEKEAFFKETMRWGNLKAGTKVNKANPLFPRIVSSSMYE